MRISETKVVQLVESTPPKLVIVDETDGSEIAFTMEEASLLMHTIVYFCSLQRPQQEG